MEMCIDRTERFGENGRYRIDFTERGVYQLWDAMTPNDRGRASCVAINDGIKAVLDAEGIDGATIKWRG